jgi:hypothetical protein
LARRSPRSEFVGSAALDLVIEQIHGTSSASGSDELSGATPSHPTQKVK